MFKRGWFGLGRIRSDEGYTVHYGHGSLFYTDERGTFGIGYEDGMLFPDQVKWEGPNGPLSESERDQVLKRMLEALEWDGHSARIYKRR
jgi:hypothetical protein